MGAGLVPAERDLPGSRSRQVAFESERKIKDAMVKANVAWWDLARMLYEFHEQGYWSLLGYETLDEFLAQPDLGLSRSQFFRMTRLWRTLAVQRKIPVQKLKQLEPSKVREVAPAIERGDVKIDKALSDVATLGHRDVRAKYNAVERAKRGVPESTAPGDEPLAAETEPVQVQCEHCGSWYTPTEGDDDDDA